MASPYKLIKSGFLISSRIFCINSFNPRGKAQSIIISFFFSSSVSLEHIDETGLEQSETDDMNGASLRESQQVCCNALASYPVSDTASSTAHPPDSQS